jgi:orotidine-5'-phosphate decarboxylase
MTFGARLREAMTAKGPLCVGIDPHPGLLDAWGLTDSAVGLERFSMTVVDALAGSVAALKPQSAFFERHGAAGVAVLEKVVAEARERGTLVLLDAKRGDIGSTAQAYADAYLDRSSPLAADAVTASPYLGFGSLEPLLDAAEANDAGVFVLALTSNPEGRTVQRARTESGRTVAGEILAAVAARNVDADGWGSVGAVVGATVGEVEEDLGIGGPLLVPGLGAQGATSSDVRRVFGDAVTSVLASSSRAVLQEGPDKAALHRAATRTARELADLLP